MEINSSEDLAKSNINVINSDTLKVILSGSKCAIIIPPRMDPQIPKE